MKTVERSHLKNLPDRHMPSADILLRQHFERHAAVRVLRP